MPPSIISLKHNFFFQDGLAEMQGLSEEPFADVMYQQGKKESHMTSYLLADWWKYLVVCKFAFLASYDPNSMDSSQMHVPSPAGVWDQQQNGAPPGAQMYHGGIPPQQQGAPIAHHGGGHVNPQASWYDTDC